MEVATKVRGTQEILLSAVEVYFKQKQEQLERKYNMDMFILAGEKAETLKTLGEEKFESCLGGVRDCEMEDSVFFTHKSFLIDSSDLVLTDQSWTSRKEWQDAPE